MYTNQSCKLFYFKMIRSSVDVCKIICYCQIDCQIYHVHEFKYMLLLLFYIIEVNESYELCIYYYII